MKTAPPRALVRPNQMNAGVSASMLDAPLRHHSRLAARIVVYACGAAPDSARSLVP